ncbi:MAG TPA: anti-sigma factor [Thermoleophilaceae bacterium]|nr:anti-sigma factor [Thermoleophilaceae bacterium]
MATFDQLSEDQRAVVELVLRRGKDYEQLSELLDMSESRVRELARQALVDLAPLSARGVEEDWRGQLADYVLGQQSGPEATATRGHLRRSEAARTWARSLLDSLEQLYENGSLPAIPEGERGARARRPEQAADAGPLGVPDAIARRRGIALAGGLLAVALVALLLWPVGLLIGDDDSGGGGEGEQAAQSATRSGNPAGAAVVLGQGSQRAVQVQATGLEPSTREFAYQFWLYNDRNEVRSLGAQVADENGTLQAVGNLPKGFEKFKYFDLSREPIGGDEGHSGQSVLRGAMPQLAKVQGNDKITRLGQVVLAPPSS